MLRPVLEDVVYLVLDLAGDGSPLWELTWGLRQFGASEYTQIHAPCSVDEVRPALLELVSRGFIELYDLADPQGPSLEREKAEAVIADDGFWVEQRESGTNSAYGLALTEAGDAELDRLIASRT
jgi:hypothetical protein